MATTTLHLVRHGEAEPGGGADPGLSENGWRQARAVAERLADVVPEVVMHSPKRRARETAEVIGAMLPGIPVVSSDIAADRTPVPSDRTTVPQRYWAFLDEVPGEERDLDGRQLEAGGQLLGAVAAGDRCLVVVTHAFVIGWYVREALDAPTWRWLGLNHVNGALTTITYTVDGSRLICFNDSGHLRLASE